MVASRGVEPPLKISGYGMYVKESCVKDKVLEDDPVPTNQVLILFQLTSL